MDFPLGFKEKYEELLGQEAEVFFATFDQDPISAFRSNPLKVYRYDSKYRLGLLRKSIW